MNETQTISRRGRFQKLDGFVLKIIALLTMTLDHVAVAIESVLPTYDYLIVEGGALYNIVLALHIIGRLSFPIFIFLLAEFNVKPISDLFKFAGVRLTQRQDFVTKLHFGSKNFGIRDFFPFDFHRGPSFRNF